jgi:putative ABC transport system ATP-binding protein
MTPLLEARQIAKAHTIEGVPLPVLKDVDLVIDRGDYVSIMGPSGSGKSTLLSIVSGLDTLTSGRVTFADQVLGDLTEDARADLRLHAMGFVFQQPALLKNLCLLDNVLLPGLAAKATGRDELMARARQLMERTGVGDLAERSITEASGGQLQRVAICRALINQPDLLFADEPTGALNSRATAEVLDVLAEAHRLGTTILLVTHDARVAAHTERVVFMSDGEIAGTKTLGPYAADELTARERTLTEWLTRMGL